MTAAVADLQNHSELHFLQYIDQISGKDKYTWPSSFGKITPGYPTKHNTSPIVTRTSDVACWKR